MTQYPRYAIYFVPDPEDALYRFGAEMLGYDAFSGATLPFPNDMLQSVPDWEQLTEDPRKYGFHATLKAPISLAPNQSESDLAAALGVFARAPRQIPVIQTVSRSLSGFIAVVPETPVAALNQFVDDCVTEFDHFRAPLTPQDRARRNPDRLTPRQRDYLDRWGYPYVFEEFRFHMTLTGRLTTERGAAVLGIIQQRFARLAVNRLSVDRIGLFRQRDAGSRFTIVDHWPLTPR